MNVTQVTSSILKIHCILIHYRPWANFANIRARKLGKNLGLNLPSKGPCIKAKDVDLVFILSILVLRNREQVSFILVLVCIASFFTLVISFYDYELIPP